MVVVVRVVVVVVRLLGARAVGQLRPVGVRSPTVCCSRWLRGSRPFRFVVVVVVVVRVRVVPGDPALSQRPVACGCGEVAIQK